MRCSSQTVVNLCLKVGVSIISSGCYWLVRDQTSTASCSNQCNTNLWNIASNNGGNNIPPGINAYFFMCIDNGIGELTNAISISFDGNTIDPAPVVASNNGAMTVSTCNCKFSQITEFLYCKSVQNNEMYLHELLHFFSNLTNALRFLCYSLNIHILNK